MPFMNGLGTNLSSLPFRADAVTHSISPENFTGEKGKGGMALEGTQARTARYLGQGWKISPSVVIKSGETFVMGEVSGSGTIQQVWMTPTGHWRFNILRIYWDGSDTPAVECPVGDFFACGWQKYWQVSSLAVCVNPAFGLNSYWQMPFRKGFKVTMTNISDEDMTLYYQINYCLAELPQEALYLHAQFRRVNPLPYKEIYTILDGVKGEGQYIGTSMAWGSNNSGWWGEGEVKFFLDGDKEFPTICGTGLEDYFCGSYDFSLGKENGGYRDFTTPYTGFSIIRPDGHYASQTRFNMYRWHIMDPIRFKEDIRVTVQALGWEPIGKRFLPLQDDIASVAYWYQNLPTMPFPELPHRDYLEVI
jgi:hypothetical protein